MSDPALIAALGSLAAVLLGVGSLWVKMNRAVGSNGGSTLHQIVGRIDRRQQEQGERLARVEATIAHLSEKRGD